MRKRLLLWDSTIPSLLPLFRVTTLILHVTPAGTWALPWEATWPLAFRSANKDRIQSRPTPGHACSMLLNRKSPGWRRTASGTRAAFAPRGALTSSTRYSSEAYPRRIMARKKFSQGVKSWRPSCHTCLSILSIEPYGCHVALTASLRVTVGLDRAKTPHPTGVLTGLRSKWDRAPKGRAHCPS